MRDRLLWCTLALAAGVASAPLGAQAVSADSAKRIEARALLELTGAGTMMLRTMELTIPAQKQALPNVPEAFWDTLLRLAKRDAGLLVEAMVPLYTTRFTLDELKQLGAFYRTPLGRKLAVMQPEIASDGMRIGQEWGQRLGEEAASAMTAPPAPADSGRRPPTALAPNPPGGERR